MKVTHTNRDTSKTLNEWMLLAKENETKQNAEEAIDAYEHIIKEYPKKEYAYQRLMILYRKKKEYKQELRIVEAALKNFQHVLGNKPNKKQNKKISLLSLRLMKTTGLTNKKDEPAFLPEPLHKWTNRKMALERRIAKQK